MEYGYAFINGLFRVKAFFLLNKFFRKENPSKETTYQINVYYRSNYDWSLKYSRKTSRLVSAKFSDSLPLRAFLLSEDGKFEVMDFKMEYQNSLINNNFCSDNGTISVLSANKLKLTPLRYVNMPPPMCLEELELNNSPPFIVNWWKNYLFVLSNSTIEIIHSNNLRDYTHVKKFSNISEIETHCVKSFIFVKNMKEFDTEGINGYYETEGYLILNKSITNDDKNDDLIIILIKLKVNFRKQVNEPDYIEFNEILNVFTKKFDRITSLFNSTFADNLYEKKFYNDKLSELQMASLQVLSNAKESNKEAKNENVSKATKNKKEKNKDEDIFTKLKNTDFDNLDIGNYREEDELGNSFDEKVDEDNVFSMLGVQAKHPDLTHPHHKEGHLYKHAGRYAIFFYAIVVGRNKEKNISKVRINVDLDLYNIVFKSENISNNQAEKDKIIKIEYEEDSIISSNYDIIKAHSAIIKSDESQSNIPNAKIQLEEKVVYLTRNNRLYLNNNYLAADATSFEIFKNFLIFTQTSNSPYNILHILDLSNTEFILNLKQQINKNDPIFVPNFNYKHFSMRTLERTSLIVTVTRNNLIAQMSRGNLETFYPRLLVLDSVVESVANRNYLEAFELVRKNKINPNFLYDIDPEGFFINIESFVKQINKVKIKLIF